MIDNGETSHWKYSKLLVELLSCITDRVVFDPRERALLKDFINAGGDINKMSQWGMNDDQLRHQVKVATIVLSENLKDYRELIEENATLRRKLALASEQQIIESPDSFDKDSEDRTDDESDILISEIKMSKRLLSGLQSIGIKRLSELEDHTWMEYKQIENVGAKSLNELKRLFEKYGLLMPAVPYDLTPDQISVDDLPYNRWVKDSLKINGIMTLADCSEYSEREIYSFLGRKNIVKRIKNKLAKYGLSYKL